MQNAFNVYVLIEGRRKSVLDKSVRKMVATENKITFDDITCMHSTHWAKFTFRSNRWPDADAFGADSRTDSRFIFI